MSCPFGYGRDPNSIPNGGASEGNESQNVNDSVDTGATLLKMTRISEQSVKSGSINMSNNNNNNAIQVVAGSPMPPGSNQKEKLPSGSAISATHRTVSGTSLLQHSPGSPKVTPKQDVYLRYASSKSQMELELAHQELNSMISEGANSTTNSVCNTRMSNQSQLGSQQSQLQQQLLQSQAQQIQKERDATPLHDQTESQSKRSSRFDEIQESIQQQQRTNSNLSFQEQLQYQQNKIQQQLNQQNSLLSNFNMTNGDFRQGPHPTRVHDANPPRPGDPIMNTAVHKTYYHDYLQLGKILHAQYPMSKMYGHGTEVSPKKQSEQDNEDDRKGRESSFNGISQEKPGARVAYSYNSNPASSPSPSSPSDATEGKKQQQTQKEQKQDDVKDKDQKGLDARQQQHAEENITIPEKGFGKGWKAWTNTNAVDINKDNKQVTINQNEKPQLPLGQQQNQNGNEQENEQDGNEQGVSPANRSTFSSKSSCVEVEVPGEAHDETLFIITHQAYELWFKQILHELQSILTIFQHKKKYVEDRDMSTICRRLQRVTKIQEVLNMQIGVLETMTPMDFLDFRDYLIPASGFQSWQFRLIEISLGIPIEKRRYGTEQFLMGVFHDEDKAKIQEMSTKPSLSKLVEQWLERMPFYKTASGYDFWHEYQTAVENMIKKDEELIYTMLDPTQQENELKSLHSLRTTFESLFDDKIHKEMQRRGVRTWSQKAILSALFILLYRNEPMLAMPFWFLQLLMEVDQNFTVWRSKHATMAMKMLGMKMGTGGTSGVEYLQKAANENKAFKDLWGLSTFLVPSNALPKLPTELKEQLGFLHTFQTENPDYMSPRAFNNNIVINQNEQQQSENKEQVQQNKTTNKSGNGKPLIAAGVFDGSTRVQVTEQSDYATLRSGSK